MDDDNIRRLEKEVTQLYPDVAHKYEFMVDAFSTSMTFINRDHIYEGVNATFAESLGLPKEEIIGHSVAEMWGDEIYHSVIKKHLDKCFQNRPIHYKETFKFGTETKHMDVSYLPYTQYGNFVSHVIVLSDDRTEEKQLMEQLERYAYTDRTTGLPNRTALELSLGKMLDNSKRENNKNLRSILYISLDNLNRVNETYTHEIGDVLLENSGLRIQKIMMEDDSVFRFEGKDLVVTLTDVKSEEQIASVAEQIRGEIAHPYNFRGQDITLKPHIGISTYPTDAEDFSSLIQHASSAMSEAKQSGETYRFYDKSIHQKAIDRMKMESDLYHAIQKHHFEMYYQPIVNKEEKIIGAEALMRLNHPERGLVCPDEFIPLAEQTGFIIPMGRWALYSVYNQLEEWSDYNLYISLNMSPKQFTEDIFFRNIEQLFSRPSHLLPQGSLKVEITEHEAIENYQMTLDKIEKLQEYGVEILIDDFGVGNSSLASLKGLPAHTLKIDKLFVDEIAYDEGDREYLGTIISLAHIRGKSVICEGVETEEQVRLLQAMDCDAMQGYYFNKPLPVGQFEEYLEQQYS